MWASVTRGTTVGAIVECVIDLSGNLLRDFMTVLL